MKVDPEVTITEPVGDSIAWTPGNLRALLCAFVVGQQAVLKLLSGESISEADRQALQGVRRALWALDASNSAHVRKLRTDTLARMPASALVAVLEDAKAAVLHVAAGGDPRTLHGQATEPAPAPAHAHIAVLQDAISGLQCVLSACVLPEKDSPSVVQERR